MVIIYFTTILKKYFFCSNNTTKRTFITTVDFTLHLPKKCSNNKINLMKTVLYLFLVSLVVGNVAFAQCPSVSFGSNTITDASCPSGGSISITASGGTGFTYQLINGPSGFQTSSNSTGVFNSLTAGNYTIQATNGCGNSATVIKTVANTYPTFSVSNAATSNVCGSNVAGGSISATVTGGKPPYQYDIVAVGNTPTYGAAIASTNFSKTVSTFDTYRVYSKDACGEVRTYDIILAPNQPVPTNLWYEDLMANRPCNETVDGLPTTTWKLHILDENGHPINFFDMIGATYQIYKPAIANSIDNSEENSNCSTSLGILLSAGTVRTDSIDGSDANTYQLTIPQEDVILILTNKCGQTLRYCYNFNNSQPYVPVMNTRLIKSSCNAVWSNQTLYAVANVQNMKAPITYLLTKNDGATITQIDYNYFDPLSPTDFPLTIKATDTCGKMITKTIAMPTQGSALQFTINPEWGLTCTKEKNAASAYISFTDGDFPGLAQATNIVITGASTTVIPTISPFQDWINGYTMGNLLAGQTYKVTITNLCGYKDSVSFTVPLDQWNQPVLNWNLTATKNALCGQNKSTINAKANYTGYYDVNYYLFNLNNPNNAIANNITGIFNDVSSGNYKVKMVVLSANSNCPDADIKDSINISILNDAVGQVINRKTITTCESNGVSTNTGKVLIDVSGSAPFTYEIIKTNLVGTGAGEVWTLSSSNNPENIYTWALPQGSDPSNTQYTIRSTDKCDNKITSQASLQPINPPAIVAGTQNPCNNSVNYTFGITRYATGFTYKWVKLPDSTTTLSTTENITLLGAYNATYNGTYRCYVSLGGCIDRYIDVVVSNQLCNQVLSVNLINFTANKQNENVLLEWVAENQTNFSHFEVERSTDAANFISIKNVIAINNNATVKYNATDNISNVVAGRLFYRLKIVDKDGKYSYSKIIVIKINTEKNNILVYPTPAQSFVNIELGNTTAADYNIQILDAAGKLVQHIVKKNVCNGEVITINRNGLAAGMYTLKVENMQGNETRYSKIIYK